MKAGHILLVGSMMHFSKEVIAYRDPKTKEPATFNKVQFTVLGANGVVFVQPDTRRMPGFKMETFVSPFKIGQPVVVDVERITVERGVTTIQGMVEPLEA